MNNQINQQTSEEINSDTLSTWIVEGMLDKKAHDVIVMDLREIKHAITDYFVICSGNSTTQIDAISDAIEDQVHKNSKQNPWRREGQQSKEWLLLDYVDVVVHVFNEDRRMYYGLENLWGDAKITRIRR